MQFYQPLKEFKITQTFGVNRWRFAYGAEGHQGLDCRAKFQTPVLAAQDGVVIEVRDTPFYDAYGKYVVIKHKEGYYTLYAHLDIIDVKVGDIVFAGHILGYTGGDWRKYAKAMRYWAMGWKYTPAGWSSGPHLHFELRHGKNLRTHAVNPLPLLSSYPAKYMEKQEWHKKVEQFALDKGIFQDMTSVETFVAQNGGNDKAHRLLSVIIKAGPHKEALEQFVK